MNKAPSRRILWCALLILLLAACGGSGTPTPQAAATRTTAGVSAPLPTCRTPYTNGMRRPERFLLVHDCTVLMGTIIGAKVEADGDTHYRFKLDADPLMFANAENVKQQAGALVLEIEPHAFGQKSTAIGADAVNSLPPEPYCPAACHLTLGQRLRVTSVVVTDTLHGWSEVHEPSNIEIIGMGAIPVGVDLAPWPDDMDE